MRTRVEITDYVENDWEGLTMEVKRKLNFFFSVLEEEGALPRSKLKALSGTRLWEFRVSNKGETFRALGGFYDNSFLITAIFKKQTQKVPLDIIKLAEKRFNTFVKNQI